MYMKHAGGSLQYELSVCMTNCCTENNFDLDSVKNKNKISMNEKKAN